MVACHILYSFCCLIPLLCSGCKKTPGYYDLVPSEFPQGDEPENVSSLVHKNLRSVKIYNQFTTEAIFDVLFFSDEIQAKYVALYGARRGTSEEANQKHVNALRGSSKKMLTYYILADIRDVQSQTLVPKEAVWSLYLRNSKGKKIEPAKIKEIELEPELRQFFLHRFNRYKTAYIVTFPSVDALGKPYFEGQEKPSMVLSSVTQERTLSWQEAHTLPSAKSTVPSQKSKTLKPIQPEAEIKDEDFYWG